MNCLYCGQKLGLFSKGREFCNGKHQELFRKRESELAIQRLMQPFGSVESPAAKAWPATSTPTSDPAPENALIPTKVKRVVPPATRDQAEDRPGNRFNTKDPAKVAAALPGSASSERTAPPLAGFIALSELKPVMRLPVFTRRPEPGSYGSFGPRDLDRRFIDQSLARRAGEERRAEVGFPAILCIPPIHPCEPGLQAGRLFVEAPDLELSILPVEPRKAGFQACQLSDTALQMPAFAPHPEESEPRVYALSGAVFYARPIAMSRRGVEHKPAVAEYPDIVQTSLPHVAGPQPQAACITTTALALGAAIVRVRPALPNSGFQTLATGHSTPVVPVGTAAQCADLPDRKLFRALPIDPRKLAVHARTLSTTALNTPGFAAHRKEPEPRAYTVSGATYGARPIAMSRRTVERKLLVARHPEIVQASLPHLAGPLPQAAGGTTALRALGAAIGRVRPALSNSAFQALAIGHGAPALSASTAAQRADLPDRKLFRALPIEQRKPEFDTGKLPFTALQTPAFAPYSKEPESSVYGVSDATYDARPIAMSRRAIERQPVAARHPEIVQVSLAHIAAPLPQAASGATYDARPIAMSSRAVERQPVVARYPEIVQVSLAPIAGPRPQAASGATYDLPPNVIPSRAVERQPVVARYPEIVQVSLAHIAAPLPQAAAGATYDLRPNVIPSRAVERQPVVARYREIVQVSLHIAGPPPQAASVATYDVRPNVIPSRAVERNSVVARFSETVQTSLPHIASPRPQAARSAKAPRALAGTIGRVRPTLPNSAFQTLPAEHNAAILVASAAAQCAAFTPCAKHPEARLHGASGAVYDVRPMALSLREAEPKPVAARYPEIVQASLPHRVACPQPRTGRYSKAPRALAAAIRRVRPALPNSAFQTLPIVQDAPDARTRAATAPCAKLPHRKFFCSALPIEPRTMVSHAWKLASANLQIPAFAPHPKEAELRLNRASCAAYDVRPIALSRREAERERVVAKFPEILPASLPHRAGPTPQEAGYSAAPRALGAAIGRVRPALPNSAFQAMPAWQGAAVVPATTAAQCADLPDRKLLCTALRIEPRSFDTRAWKLVVAALQTAAVAPPPKESEQRVCVVADVASDARPIAMTRRAVEREPVVVGYTEIVQAALPHITVPEPRSGLYSTATRALRAAIRRAKPALPNSAFQVLAGAHTAAVAPAGAATGVWRSSTADIAIPIHRRHVQFAAVASTWRHPSGLLDAIIGPPDLEFSLGDSDYTVPCPSRPGLTRGSKLVSFHRFAPWSQLPDKCVEPPQQPSFLSLQTSLNAAPGGTRMTAILAGIAGWTRAREAPDQYAPILQPAPQVSVPEQPLPAVALKHTPAAKSAWTEGRVSVMEVRTQPAVTEPSEPEPLDAEELTRALAHLGAGGGANSRLKWTALKVPWHPLP
jgi:hypothetical protein